MLFSSGVTKLISTLIRIAVAVLAVGAFLGACGQQPGRVSNDKGGAGASVGSVWLPDSVPQPPPPSPPLPLAARWVRF
jgi:hypothetical protein